MRILLFGKNGQLGWELQRTLAPLGTMVALDRNGQQGLCGDLANREGIAATLGAVKPDIIVNAAAYTAVDKAEQEHEQATRINAGAPAQMAEYAHRTGALLVHYSTDYVFNGSGVTPWSETDPTGPVNHYGASKLRWCLDELPAVRLALRRLSRQVTTATPTQGRSAFRDGMHVAVGSVS